MTDREFARAHRVSSPPTQRPGLWVLAAVGCAPFAVAAVRARWGVDLALVGWGAVLAASVAVLVGLPAHWRHRALVDVLARHAGEVRRLEQANERLHRAVDDAVAHPCSTCPAEEREAS